MKQITVISGKGGTGKTVVTGAFAALTKKGVIVDCDVDAADLYLLMEPEIREEHLFQCGKTASIDEKACSQCGECIEVCRFNAIDEDFKVDPISCEGCGFCSLVCPNEAIEMVEKTSGKWFISDTRFGPLVHAKLGVAEENSGKLVSLLRRKAKEIAKTQNLDLVIIDGPPGIGCPVIASLSGVDFALVVAEPTLSGLHDCDRVVQVARHFNVDVKLVVNKYDLNTDMTEKIEEYCYDNEIPFIGRIEFDEAIVGAMIEGKTIIEYPNGKTKEKIAEIWDTLKRA